MLKLPTRLHHPPATSQRLSPHVRVGMVENEERRRAFWSAFVLDRLVSAGGWSHSLFEQDSVPNYRGEFPIMSTKEFKELGSVSSLPLVLFQILKLPSIAGA